MERYDFDSVLFPLNFATFYQGNFGPRILQAAKSKGVARLAIKALAKQKWPKDDPTRQQYSKCWYQPLTDRNEAKLALYFTLSQPITAAHSAGRGVALSDGPGPGAGLSPDLAERSPNAPPDGPTAGSGLPCVGWVLNPRVCQRPMQSKNAWVQNAVWTVLPPEPSYSAACVHHNGLTHDADQIPGRRRLADAETVAIGHLLGRDRLPRGLAPLSRGTASICSAESMPLSVTNPLTGSMTEGSVPQSVSEVLLSFHFMPVLAARAVATRSSRSAVRWACPPAK